MARASRRAGRSDYVLCKRCNASRHDGTKISSRGLCVDCSTKAVSEGIEQMITGQGPHARRWAESMAQAALAALDRTA